MKAVRNRKINRIRNFGCVFFFFLSIHVYSQLPKAGTQLKLRYKEYIHPNGPTGTVLRRDQLTVLSTSGMPWIVYADQDNVDSYQSPTSKIPFKKLKFMEPFCVTDVEGDYLKIVKYSDEIFDVDTKKLNDKYDASMYYGWVPVSSMLIWEQSLIDPGTKFIIKALTAHQPEALANPSLYAENNKVKLYVTPDLSSRSENQIKLFNFYYIFKEDVAHSSYLIGKDYEITDPKEASRIILGWVPKNIIQLWKKRLCLETNYDADAVREMSGQSVNPCIYRTKQAAANFEKGQAVENEYQLKCYEAGQRFKSQNKRLPILEIDSKDSSLVQTAFVTAIYGSDGQEVESVEKHNDDEKNFNAQSREARKINLIFVLGGSDNVKSYYQNIIDGIQSAMDKYNIDKVNNKSNNTFNFGCVIYTNKKCNEDPVSLNLSSDVSKITDFILRYKNDYRSCSSSKPEYSALLPGIDKACFLLAGHEKESNLLVIIGDAGSKPDESKKLLESVTNKVEKLKCGWLVYQVINPGTDAFENFSSQTRRIAENANKHINEYLTTRVLTSLDPQLKKITSGNSNWSTYKFDENTSALFGQFKFASAKNLDPLVLSDDIKRATIDVNRNIDRLIDHVQDFVSGAGEKTKNISPGMALFLKDMKYDLDDPKFLAQIKGDNFQFCIKGWLSLKRQGIQSDIFRYNVFVTSEEFEHMKKLMNDIVSTAYNDATDTRKNLENIYIETIKQYLGGSESEKVIKNMKLDEIMQYVTGIPTRSELFKKYRLKDIESKLTSADLKDMINIIRDKKEKLRSIESDSNFRRFDMDKRTFYWIPDDYLP